MITSIARQWYVIRPVVRGEFRALAELDEHGIEAFLPIFKRYTLIRHTKGKRREKSFPLLPGYLFARIDISPNSHDLALMEDCKSVQALVKPRAAPRPVPVSDKILADLRRLCDDGAFDQGKRNGDGFLQGDRVRIVDGPFSGFTVTFRDGKTRAGAVRVILDTMWGGKLHVEVAQDALVAA